MAVSASRAISAVAELLRTENIMYWLDLDFWYGPLSQCTASSMHQYIDQ